MRATAVGSYPGTDAATFTETVKAVLGELEHGLPHLPELPGRGPGATMVGRTLAMITDLDADLQPGGWRLTGGQGAPGLDQRRARSLLGRDLDSLEEHVQEWTGPFKVQVAGPWTLAATVELPRGESVLGDPGARRDLTGALAEAVRAHVAEVRRRVPHAERVVVQLDEPALPTVLTGSVPTASGLHRHRTVEPPLASAALETVLGAIAGSEAEPWVHSCAAGVPWDLVHRAGARGLLVDPDTLSAADHDRLAGTLEAGGTVGLGVVPSREPATDLGAGAVAERVVRWLDMLGMDPDDVGDRLVLTPGCGLAGADAGWARRALRLVREAAGELTP